MSTERAGPVSGYKVCRGDRLWCSVLLCMVYGEISRNIARRHDNSQSECYGAVLLCMVQSAEILLGDMITVSQNVRTQMKTDKVNFR